LCSTVPSYQVLLPFSSSISHEEESGIYGEVTIFAEDGNNALLQMEGMRAVPFSSATATDDKKIFSTMVWGLAGPNGEAAALHSRATNDDYELASIIERVCLYYLKNLDAEIPKNHHARYEGSYMGLFRYTSHLITWVQSGRHPYINQEWLDDTLDSVLTLGAEK
jgi:hybrid polyketide synthase/nonribosomal peptide synthetase ACE1